MSIYTYKSTTGTTVNIDSYVVTVSPGLTSKYQIDALDNQMGTTIARYTDGILDSTDDSIPVMGKVNPVTGGVEKVTANGISLPMHLWGLDNESATESLAKSLAKVRSGVADCRILLVGDSTTWGTGANPGVTSPAPLLASRLAAATGMPVIANMLIPESVDSSQPDSRVTLGAGWAKGGSYGWGSNATWQNAGSGGNLSFAYANYADKIRIYYLQNGGLGTFTPTVNGVAKTAQSAAGSAQVGVYEANFTRSNAITLNIAATINTVFILGVEFLDTAQKCIYIGGAGVPATTTGNWGAAGSWSGLAMISAYAPNHSLINLGINDSAGSVAASAYEANLTVIAARCHLTGSVDLHTPNAQDPSLNRGAFESAYLQKIVSIAATGGYGIIDTRKAIGEWVEANANGFFADQIHPAALGNAIATRATARRIVFAEN